MWKQSHKTRPISFWFALLRYTNLRFCCLDTIMFVLVVILVVKWTLFSSACECLSCMSYCLNKNIKQKRKMMQENPVNGIDRVNYLVADDEALVSHSSTENQIPSVASTHGVVQWRTGWVGAMSGPGLGDYLILLTDSLR